MGSENKCATCGGHDGFGHICRNTVTIPVAEYEGLRRRAGFWAAGVTWRECLRLLCEQRDRAITGNRRAFWRAEVEALAAAIKEQEG